MKEASKMLGWLAAGFLGLVAVLGFVGWLISRRNAEEKTRDDAENVADLRDRFNRARYMNQDGE